MLIINVTKDKLSIEKDATLNKGEYNVTKCKFNFSKEYTANLVKKAVFFIRGKKYVYNINNDMCKIPYEAVKYKGTFEIGVFAYEVDKNDNKLLRYSPTPIPKTVNDGSYVEDYDNSQPVIPSEFEQYQQALNDGLNKVSEQLNTVAQIGQNVKNQGTEAEKQANYAKEQGDYAKSEGYYAEEQGNYAKEQGDYAKEKADGVINANSLAITLINEFESHVNDCTSNFNDNAKLKMDAFETNATTKTNEFNNNAKIKIDEFDANYDSKLKSFDDNTDSKIVDFNQNVELKIDELDSHATSKTTEFNTNATTKKVDYDKNAEASVEAFNTNASTKTTEFNNNSKTKTEEFDTNYNTKLKLFNDNANSKTSDFDDNVKSKTDEFNTNVVNKTKDFNTNANNKLDEYNTNSVQKMNEYNTNAEAKINEFNNNLESYDKRIKDNTKRIKAVETDIFDIAEASGSSISIQDSTLAEFIEIEIDGELNQKTTEGKNLCHLTNATVTTNGLEITIEDDILKLNGTTTAAIAASLPIWKNIKFSINSTGQHTVSTTDNIDGASFGYYKSENTDLIPTTAELTETGDYNVGIYIPAGKTFNNFTTKIQVEKGSVKTDYEPFTNGLSPNLNYQQPIQVIEEEFDLIVSSEKVETTTHISIPEGKFAAKFDEKNKDKFSLAFNEADGKYHLYLDKMIGRIVLDGTENWKERVNLNGVKQFYTPTSASGVKEAKQICNYFANYKQGLFNYGIINEFAILTNTVEFFCCVESDLTLDEFKAKLNKNNLICYYQYLESRTIDLGSIDMPYSYNTITNVSTNHPLQLNIRVKYYKNFKSDFSSVKEEITTIKKDVQNLSKEVDKQDERLAILTPKNKAKDSLVHVEDALALPVFKVGIDGKNFQETTKGINILDTNSLIEQTINGVTFTPIYKNRLLQYIKVNGTATSNAEYQVGILHAVEDTRYYYSGCPEGGSTSTYAFGVSSLGLEYGRGMNYLNEQTIDRRCFIRIYGGQVCNDLIFKPMITTNSTEYTIEFYEPPTNGPSPNSDFPQEIETLKGYNLFDYDSYTYDNTTSSVYRFVEIKNLKPNTVYTISGYEKITRKNTAICLNKVPNNPNILDYLYKFLKTASTWGNENSVTFTTDESGKCYLGIYDTTETTWNEVIKWFEKAVLVEGTEVKPYLPFGCIRIKMCEKNLCSPLKKGRGINSTSGEEFSTNVGAVSDYIKIDFNKNQNYYTSGLLDTLQSFFAAYDKDFNFIGRNNGIIRSEAKLKREDFVSGNGTKDYNNIKYIRVYQYVGSSSGAIDDIENARIQLEPGSTATTYDPYKERIYYLDLKGHEVLSGDKIVVDRKGNVVLIKKWGKKVFDGTENWKLNSFSEDNYRYWLESINFNTNFPNCKIVTDANDGYIYFKCSHFKGSTFANGNVGNFAINNKLNVNWFLLFSNISTLDEFKKDLKNKYDNGKPVYAQYPLATSEIIDLGTIDPIGTFEGTNNIEVLASLDTEIEVEYALDIKKYIDNLHKENGVIVQNE